MACMIWVPGCADLGIGSVTMKLPLVLAVMKAISLVSKSIETNSLLLNPVPRTFVTVVGGPASGESAMPRLVACAADRTDMSRIRLPDKTTRRKSPRRACQEEHMRIPHFQECCPTGTTACSLGTLIDQT